MAQRGLAGGGRGARGNAARRQACVLLRGLTAAATGGGLPREM
jgi:hypothetical protein